LNIVCFYLSDFVLVLDEVKRQEELIRLREVDRLLEVERERIAAELAGRMRLEGSLSTLFLHYHLDIINISFLSYSHCNHSIIINILLSLSPSLLILLLPSFTIFTTLSIESTRVKQRALNLALQQAKLEEMERLAEEEENRKIEQRVMAREDYHERWRLDEIKREREVLLMELVDGESAAIRISMQVIHLPVLFRISLIP
jgi:hypothetical protein